MTLWLGIDIGTTNTRACVYDSRDGSIVPLRCEEGDKSLPTKIAFDPDNGKLLVGAQANYHLHRIQHARSFLGK